MTQSTSAALHIQGPMIRYAEVEREGKAQDLRRLGTLSFSFDVVQVLWGEKGDEELDRIAEAIQEEFSGSDAATLRVVVHPLDVFSVFVPVPVGLSDSERRRYAISQTALVTGARSPDMLTLALQPVRPVEGDDASEWTHVLALPQEVAGRMDRLTGPLPVQDVVRMVSTEAAARVLGHTRRSIASSVEGDATYSLAIGQYATHTEYSLLRDGAWYHAHAAQEARSLRNRAYYAVGFLNRVGVAVGAVDRLVVYGSNAAPGEPLETVFDCQPVSLDPFEGLRRMPDGFEKPEGAEAFVPCIGGALVQRQS